MKKLFLSLSVIALLATACNQTNSAESTTETDTTQQSMADQREAMTENLSYAGTYEGVLPCADCAGIKTTLTVDKESYTLKEEYEGKEGVFDSKGSVSYDAEKQLLTLTDAANANDKRCYRVTEGALKMLSADGSEITDTELAAKYVLNKK